MIFPRKLSLFFGRIFGLCLYLFSKKSRHIAHTNINVAFPQLSEKKSKELLIKTFIHYGMISFEFFRQKSNKKININVDNNTKNILLEKSGLILMAAHFGNWEIFLPIISKKRKISAIVRKQNNAGGDLFISETRRFNNVSLISNQSSFNDMLKPLNNNEVLLILNDQKPKKSGTTLDFFGKPAIFPKGTGHFYIKTGLRIAVGFCTLNLDLSYNFKIKLLDIDTESKSNNELIDQINIKYAKLLEKEIVQFPEQYCWFYKKWDRSIYK